MAQTTNSKKLILVIGATGAQGLPVVSALLAPSKDGAPSPYAVRALTRDPTSTQAQQLAAAGAEIFKGSFTDLKTIEAAYEGCYGAFVNTDSFTVGQEKEIYYAIKIYEQAHRVPQMKHFIWSGLDYSSKLGKYDLKYKTVHLDGKGIVSDFLRSQPSSASGESLTWSIITTGPYLENLRSLLLGPLPKRENGIVVFATPLGDGHVPIISLDDIGWWARYTFDHRAETSGQELKIATEHLTWPRLVKTFTRVTGIPAVYKRLSLDEYFANYEGIDKSIVTEDVNGPTIRQTFTGLYNTWKDDVISRDMEWNRRIHPDGYTLESWIREKGYDGSLAPGLSILKKRDSINQKI